MQDIFDKFLISMEKITIEDQISILIFIASLNQNSLKPLEIETLSKLCSNIYTNLYGKYFDTFKEFLIAETIKIEVYIIRIRNKSLWQAIWCNSIKNFDLLPSKKLNNLLLNDQTDFLLWCIHFILDNLNILDKNSLYLLRCLQLILNRNNLLVSNFSHLIIELTNKVALSPLSGFKQLACNISKIALQFLEPSQYLEVGFLPARGIATYEIVDTFSGNFVKKNLKIIVAKVLIMFSNNTEKKDGGFLYEKILICTFEEWIDLVWPLFFNKLLQIQHEGEFFQSLIKFWIPLTINAYRSDFYNFIKGQPIDLRLKAHVLLESRKKGFLFEQENYIYNRLETLDLGLNIISTYRKKSLCPGTEEINFLINYLYSNLKNNFEDEEVDSIEKLFSHIAFVAHTDLIKSDKNFGFYTDFVNKIFNYCYKCFNTDFFEVGAQVLYHFLTILKGSHRELNLLYKLEKRNYYENGKNLLFIKLKESNLWKFDNHIYSQISNCLLKTDCYSLILTNLVCQHYHDFSFMNPTVFKNILNKIDRVPNLQNTEKIVNCSNLLFSQKDVEQSILFIDEIEEKLLNELDIEESSEIYLFRKVLFLEIITFAKKRKFVVKNIDKIIKRSLLLIDYILESSFLQESYRYTKVLETFITRVIFLISQNIPELWPKFDRKFVIITVLKIIETSNMKKPVSLSAELLRQFGYKLEEDEAGKTFKIIFLNETLNALNQQPSQSSKMRRNPNSRLVIHAMCTSEKDSEKLYLHWTMNYLLRLISNPDTPDFSMSSCLHTIELLICDNRLQQQTLSYIPDIIVHCVELFKRPNWIVRNANLQLAKSLIERLYGVSMNNFSRPKNIADLFVLYPNMASYFFKVLSKEELDDRAVILFHFFSESHINETILNDDILEIIKYFQILLVHIVKTYENQYGKLAVKSLVSISLAKDIPSVFLDITGFIKTSFVNIQKNIFANLMLLIQELYDKYKISFENQIDPVGHQSMDIIWNDLLNFLKQFNTNLFDFLLIKVKSVEDILSEKVYKNNFWVHNNLTFLFLNANSTQICKILKNNRFEKFIQVKMLTILIDRYENGEFSTLDLENLTNSLVRVALSTNAESYYLINCYFKCLLIFQENIGLKLEYKISVSTNIYKNLIILLYIAKNPSSFSSNKQIFNLIINSIKNIISINEDTDRDILSTLTLTYPSFPKKLRIDIFKIIFYYSLLKSTYLETFYFISKISHKTYNSLLDAITDFFSVDNLRKNLDDEISVKSFFNDVNNYLKSYFIELKYEDEFYVAEDKVLVPKSFIEKIFICKKCYIRRIENKE